ncbi:uncharacterized protein AKAME5_002917700 [Lates japonicus]|uniref:Uncharacterized protein n=1 Tax=Lates japonicus TaxID=270547 RepID=A0AAD3RCF8_LATJO|nr:uncharacterized protein AKAME5_002917700 [Lates japonicus]
MHSTTRSSSSEDGDNPPSQCHQFPKLPSRPTCLRPQDSYLEGDYARHAHSEAEEGWMFSGKLKQDQRPGSGLVPQQQPSSSCLNKDNRTHEPTESRAEPVRSSSRETRRTEEHLASSEHRWTSDREGQRNSLTPEMEQDDPDKRKVAQTSCRFHREKAEGGCKGGSVLRDRDENHAMSLRKLESREVQGLTSLDQTIMGGWVAGCTLPLAHCDMVLISGGLTGLRGKLSSL